jgi:hypothetical protein
MNKNEFPKWDIVLSGLVKVLKNKKHIESTVDAIANLWAQQADYLMDAYFLPFRGDFELIIKAEEMNTGLSLENIKP